MKDPFLHDHPALPAFLSEKFEMVSCLKHSEENVVCLLKEKESRRIVLLKYSDEPLIQSTFYNEKEVLDLIHGNGSSRQEAYFPRPILLEKQDQTVYYIRSYIQGRTLEELCESNRQKPGLSEDQVLDYAIHLAEQLHFLHSMTPPVIHRDIKPQNVIVDDAGHCHFIDMGISRLFDRNQSRDTIVMGTRRIAPPEQFGYRQTDMRSDIYSLGVLIYYCITGEYEITDEGMEKISESVRDVIKRATMFDPDQRYEDITRMLEELLYARFHPYFSEKGSGFQKRKFRHISGRWSAGKKRPACAKITALAVMVILLTAGALFWHFSKTDIYTFAEPLIEEAVCMQLKKEPGTITKKDLERIEELHIFGQQIYDSDDQVWLHGDDPWFYDLALHETDLFRQRGSVTDLTDISHMPNLTVLCLYNQQISDISELAGRKLEYLGLGYNPLTDLGPLEGNQNITVLNIPGLALLDYGVLRTLSGLERINLSDNPITSIDFLVGCPLVELDLYLVNLEDYSLLRQFPDLQTLKLNWMDHEIMALLEGMKISDLQFFYSKNFSLSDVKGLPDLEKLTFFGDQGPLFDSGNPIELPNLKALTFTFTQLSDFSALSQLEGLETLNLYGAELLDVKGLDRIPNLKSIDCANEFIEVINSRYPDRDFYVH